MRFILNPGKSIVEEYLTKLMLEHWPTGLHVTQMWVDDCGDLKVMYDPDGEEGKLLLWDEQTECPTLKQVKKKPYWRQGERW